MLKSFIKNLQNKDINLTSYFITLLAIIVIRTQLEFIIESPKAIAQNDDFYFIVVDYFHLILSWLTIFFNIVIIVNMFVKEDFIATAKVSIFLFPIIISVPIIDLLLGTQMKIMYQMDFSNFIFNLVNTFNFFEKDVSFPYGVRIEVLFIIIVSSIYTFIRSKNLLKSLSIGVVIYLNIFLYAYLPAIYFALFKNFHLKAKLPFIFQSNFFFYMYVPLVVFLLIIMFLKMPKKYKNTIIQSIRIERLAIYIGIFIIGMLASVKNVQLSQFFNLYDLLKILTGILSIFFAFIFSTIINDLHDVDIDKISNLKRPLVKEDMSIENFNGLKIISFFIAIIFSAAVNFYFTFLILFIISLSYLYSAPPFRLRQYFLISNLTLALIASFTFLLGVTLVKANNAILQLDVRLFIVVFVLFFISSHLKDIKDIKGDSKNNVLTIPVLLGKKESYILLSSLITLGLFFVGIYLEVGLLWSLLSVVVFVFSTILANDSERLISLLQISVGLLAIGYLV